MDIYTINQTYSPVGDIIALFNSILFLFLLKSTYTAKAENLKLFHIVNILNVVGATASIHYHLLFRDPDNMPIVLTFVFNKVMNLSLILILAFCNQYLINIVRDVRKEKLKMHGIVWVFFVIYACLELTTMFTHWGLYVNSEGKFDQANYINVFNVTYVVFILIMGNIVRSHKSRFVTKIRICLERVIFLAILIVTIQLFCRQSSFTCVTFTFPTLAALFLFHYNSYELYTGTLDDRSFRSYIKDIKRHDFTLICMRLKEIEEKKFEQMSEHFYHFNEQFFKDTCTFRMYGSKMVMVYPNWKNPNDREMYGELMRQFEELYDIYKMDYKLTFIKSDARIFEPERYIELSRYMENKMEWASYKWCDEDDIQGFLKNEIIANALKDIADSNDLDDDRIKVYCQPVLNTVSGKFTTAEALMRIVLPDYGMIYPDQFIPIAEQYEYIHTLSRIILNKTCKQVMKLEEDGYRIDRVSVNFSMIELRNNNFCQDIMDIIKDTGIEPDKIAIELTESRNEKDYELVKNIMGILHSQGMKFYLDDFGTGYSNFEKIMGLPIDIIKFDRSLTIMSSKNEASRYMVDRFADIFANSNYQILFEGVEDDADEKRCQDMKAQYLQGYKYSKPIPMEQLTEFLERN